MDRLKPTSGAAAARYELSTQQGSSATVKSHSDGLGPTTRRRHHLLNWARNKTPNLPHSKYAQFAQSQLTGPKSNRSNLVQVRRGATAKFKTNHVGSERSVQYESKWQKDSPSATGTTKFIAKGISSPAVFSKDVGNAWKSGSYARSVFTAVTGVVLGSVGVATAAASVGVGLAAGGAALAVKSVHAVGAGVVGAVTGVGYLLTQLGRGVCKGLSFAIGRGDRGRNMVSRILNRGGESCKRGTEACGEATVALFKTAAVDGWKTVGRVAFKGAQYASTALNGTITTSLGFVSTPVGMLSRWSGGKDVGGAAQLWYSPVLGVMNTKPAGFLSEQSVMGHYFRR